MLLWHLSPYLWLMSSLRLLLDVRRKVDPALAHGPKIGEERRLKDEPLAALTLDPNALWTPFVASTEWHLLDLVMLLEVLDELHHSLPFAADPTRRNNDLAVTRNDATPRLG